MIEWLQAVPNRPWETEGQINAARLARLLYPFEIRPRVLRPSNYKTSTARGYQLEQFLEPWRRQLNFIVPGKTTTSPPVVGLGPSAANTKASNLASAIELIEALNRGQNVAANQDAEHETKSEIKNQNSEILNKDRHCYAVTQDRESSFSQTNPSVPCGLSPVPCGTAVTHDVSTSKGHAKITPQSAQTDEEISQMQLNPRAKNRVNGVPM